MFIVQNLASFGNALTYDKFKMVDSEIKQHPLVMENVCPHCKISRSDKIDMEKQDRVLDTYKTMSDVKESEVSGSMAWHEDIRCGYCGDVYTYINRIPVKN